MIGVGVYALSEEGRRRFDRLPSTVAVYVGVNLIARLQATKMHRRRSHDVWERDDTSRR
jgi:hypothetical protein